ncbi:MAG: DUF58 domain-containing protein, partial [Treponema sp.]|nr:DUF58 domain-containing protein [Treponema sp.]
MPRFRFVFTPVGAAVLVISILMLVRALLNRNSYEIVIFSFALLLLLVLGVIGEWKSRKLKIMEPGWKPPFPMTASSKLASAFAAGVDDAAEISKMTQVSGLESKIPLFFRQHFYVRGRLFPGGAGFSSELKGGCSVLVETSIPRGNTSAQLPLDFPMSGIFFGDGYCKLRDIFGFFSFPCGIPQRRTVKIRCSPCFGKNIKINAKSGAEDRRYKPSADEERYYMREYSPGDRLRDINWKSSEKIDTLITRISNDNQEKVSRIEVHFRN